MKTDKPANIDAYIAGCAPDIQPLLARIRETILQAAPDAVEGISYGMPAFRLFDMPLVYFAAFNNHIGFYPAPTGVEAFKEEFSHYRTGKGSIQFPLSDPLPVDLIHRIVAFRVQENADKAQQKKKK